MLKEEFGAVYKHLGEMEKQKMKHRTGERFQCCSVRDDLSSSHVIHSGLSQDLAETAAADGRSLAHEGNINKTVKRKLVSNQRPTSPQP